MSRVGELGVVLAIGVSACSSGSGTSSAGARHMVDALHRQCSETPKSIPLALSSMTPAGCQQPIAFGTNASCNATPTPMGGCDGGSPCWNIGTAELASDLAPMGGLTMLDDGGTLVRYTAVCAACCVAPDVYATDSLTACAAIPCTSVGDCPLESCDCTNGRCQ